jgi:hypothetical protein
MAAIPNFRKVRGGKWQRFLISGKLEAVKGKESLFVELLTPKKQEKYEIELLIVPLIIYY